GRAGPDQGDADSQTGNAARAGDAEQFAVAGDAHSRAVRGSSSTQRMRGDKIHNDRLPVLFGGDAGDLRAIISSRSVNHPGESSCGGHTARLITERAA